MESLEVNLKTELRGRNLCFTNQTLMSNTLTQTIWWQLDDITFRTTSRDLLVHCQLSLHCVVSQSLTMSLDLCADHLMPLSLSGQRLSLCKQDVWRHFSSVHSTLSGSSVNPITILWSWMYTDTVESSSRLCQMTRCCGLTILHPYCKSKQV